MRIRKIIFIPVLTLPEDMVVRKIGELATDSIKRVEDALLKGLGIKK